MRRSGRAILALLLAAGGAAASTLGASWGLQNAAAHPASRLEHRTFKRAHHRRQRSAPRRRSHPRPQRPKKVHRFPSHLLVYAQEWTLWPSRTTLPAGAVSVQLWNRGQDPHDLRVRPLSPDGQPSGSSQGISAASAGTLKTALWHLSPGRYELYCALPGHVQRGMVTRLTVS